MSILLFVVQVEAHSNLPPRSIQGKERKFIVVCVYFVDTRTITCGTGWQMTMSVLAAVVVEEEEEEEEDEEEYISLLFW